MWNACNLCLRLALTFGMPWKPTQVLDNILGSRILKYVFRFVFCPCLGNTSKRLLWEYVAACIQVLELHIHVYVRTYIEHMIWMNLIASRKEKKKQWKIEIPNKKCLEYSFLILHIIIGILCFWFLLKILFNMKPRHI